MIDEGAKKIIDFVGFLYSNIENFKQYENECKEIDIAREELRQNGKPKHFTEVKRHSELNTIIDNARLIISSNVVDIIDKEIFKLIENNQKDSLQHYALIDLDIANYYDRSIFKLTQSNDDLDKKIDFRRKYMTFKREMDAIKMQLPPTVNRLDEMLKDFIAYYEPPTPPESYSINMSDEELNELYLSWTQGTKKASGTRNFATHLIEPTTDKTYFDYAITGKEIPIDKLPYKQIKIDCTISSFYSELKEVKDKKKSKLSNTKGQKLFINTDGKEPIFRL